MNVNGMLCGLKGAMCLIGTWSQRFSHGNIFFLVIVPWFDPGNYHSPLPLVGAFDRAVDKEAALL